MVFDPFGDYKTRGYLRNVLGSKDTGELRQIEHGCFIANAESAAQTLRGHPKLSYAAILQVHRTLFQDLYPWAGTDRTITAPGLEISRGGVRGIFALPSDIQRAAEHGLLRGSDVGTIRHVPGEIMGLLKFAHPFLDGNGRALMLVHDELCRRAGFHIEWGLTSQKEYLKALTLELHDPKGKHLDTYLMPYKKQGGLDLERSVASLKALPGLNTG
ncbi:Fic family protein [Rhizobium sp. Leaf383]|uniref:Fic/DOC family protein n=1 Tax=Rhizobium sp. Leaf383 TaxID=1736357 RepID=UPI0007137532|nr:Fic family protein [Rhizobium sp. Leaf383]KQS75971.1 hypothetical protein ASG58_14190 [Rhizobium sp. Leaf383]